jgi:hypothetical protein
MSDETCCGACGYPVHATKESACDWCRQSADRIEALTAKLATCEKYRDAYAECDRIGTQAVRDLEAKLAKAEKGLTCIRDGSYGKYASPAAIARATLAEIKGT